MWAPWRAEYVEKHSRIRSKGCVFCNILKENRDRKRYIFLRTEFSFAVLNIYPFNGGHALVLPRRHVDSLEAMTGQERQDLMDTVIRVKAMTQKAFAPQGFNVGMNLGQMAGAGIPEHVHVHIVPRWRGDVNFMPALFGTKIIPVSLEQVYRRLAAVQHKESRENKGSDRKKRK